MESKTLTAKERKELKKKVHKEDVKLFVGKNGVTESLIEEVNILLDKYELIKIKIQKNFSEDKDEIIKEIIDKTGASYVMDIGNVFSIYRENPDMD